MTEVNFFNYPVRIDWFTPGVHGLSWSEYCVEIMEEFGLPGDRYITTVSEDYMIFSFKHSEDAMLCKLKCL